MRVFDQSLLPYQELLLLSARPNLDEAARARIASRAAAVSDWDQLFRMARRHGLMALVYERLRLYAPNAVSPARFADVENFIRYRTRHNLQLAAELVNLLNAFDAAHIPTLALKGPTLATQAYGAIGLRSFGDLDLLVHPDDTMRAWQLLMERGYAPAATLSPSQRRAIIHSENHFGFMHAQEQLYVELHWRLVQNYYGMRLDDAGVWQRHVTMPLGGRAIATLAPSDLLLFQCIHGSKHLWQRLEWVSDIGWFIASTRALDWEWLVREATRLGVRRAFLLSMLMVNELGGVALPALIHDPARADADLFALASDLYAHLFEESVFQPEGMEQARLFMSMQDGRVKKIQYLLRFLTLPKVVDTQMANLPLSLSPLYGITRLARLGAKYFQRTLAAVASRAHSGD